MALITLIDASLAFGHFPLLDHAAFSLEMGERVGLIGRNGTGKSTLLKILAGSERVDDGVMHLQQSLRITYVAQEPDLQDEHTIFEAVAVGVARARALIDEYVDGHASADRMEQLQSEIEMLGGWTWEQRVETALSRLNLRGEQKIAELSGGGKKRVALAQALVQEPDVLLLDEPTNHLDLDAIQWLEGLLQDFRGSVVCISHDRSFLNAIATRIVELDRGVLRTYPGNFAAYESQKEDELSQEAQANARADKLLAQEEVWIRKGVEARRTRSVARIARLEKLRQVRADRRNTIGQVRLAVDAANSSGKIVSALEDLSFAYDDAKTQVRDCNMIFLRGDKVGLMGPNGAGKTTLLKLILGQLQPTKGIARQGSRLEIAYFDQMRHSLDPEMSLEDFISPGSEWVEIAGRRKHVKSYLNDFLFPAERARSPIKSLSGGERNRLLLARLFALPSNVLVLDEPTNDLDIDTLDMLEDMLQNYPGTVFLVSHDRSFLNNVVSSIVAYEGDGRWQEYEGDVDDYLTQRERGLSMGKSAAANNAVSKSSDAASTASAAVTATTTTTATKRKLSYKETRALEVLPAQIEALEVEQKSLRDTLAKGEIFAQDAAAATEMMRRDAEIDEALLELLAQWETLSA